MYILALDYYNKALDLKIKFNEKKGISAIYNNIGLIHLNKVQYLKQNKNRKEDLESALSYFYKALNIKEELNDINGQAMVHGNISTVQLYAKNYSKAILFAEKSIRLAKEIGVLSWQSSAYHNLSMIYDSLNDYKNAYRSHRLHKLINDSIFNLESNKQMEEMEARYQSEKKQLEIENLTKDKELQAVELELEKRAIQKQKAIIYSFILGFVIIIVFSGFLYRLYREKKRANALLVTQNIEIQQKNEEISSQRDEICGSARFSYHAKRPHRRNSSKNLLTA
jgi:tetratricopeptide (TPR) repeat protein